jgi:phage head-tail adaptor, putative, SPP1 family
MAHASSSLAPVMGPNIIPAPFPVLSIEPGLMRFSLDIMENQIRKSKTGSPTDNWVSIGKIRGLITPLTMAELFRSGGSSIDQVYHIATHRIHTRYNDQVDTQKRLYYHDERLDRGRWFLIYSVLYIDNRHTQLVILVKEEIYSDG